MECSFSMYCSSMTAAVLTDTLQHYNIVTELPFVVTNNNVYWHDTTLQVKQLNQ
jgi:hypothetical protein